MIDLEITRVTTVMKAILLGAKVKIGRNYYYMHQNGLIGYDSIVVYYDTYPPTEKKVVLSDNLTLERFVHIARKMTDEEMFQVRTAMKATELTSTEKIRERAQNIINRKEIDP